MTHALPPINSNTASPNAGRLANTNRKTVNVYICRLRAQLADAGVPGGATLIQRRPLSQQIRIGVALLEILHG